MARKRKRPTDYDNLTSDEIQAANAKLTAYLASHVAHKRLEYEDLLAIMIEAGPHGAAKLCDEVFAFAALLGYTPPDPPPAQPLRDGDGAALVADLDAWLAGGV